MDSESLVPKFDLHQQDVADRAGRRSESTMQSCNSSCKLGNDPADPFGLPRQEDVQIVELSFMSSEGASGLPLAMMAS